MKGLWLENGTLSFKTDLPKPKPSPDESLIRVTHVGICSTDIGLLHGMYRFVGVPGHEFVGVVETGPGNWVGKRVVGEINCGCGTCRLCHEMGPKHCLNREVIGIRNRNGAFAEHLTLTSTNLHLVPASITSIAATFIEPLAAAFDIIERIQFRESDRVLVLGDGKLSQVIARVLLNATALSAVTVIGKYKSKLARFPKQVIALTHQEHSSLAKTFDIVIECTGHPTGFDCALMYLKPQGRLVLKSTYPSPLTVDAASIVVNEISIVGSRCGPFQRAIDYLENEVQQNDIVSLIDHQMPLSSGLDAFNIAQTKQCMKVLLTI